MPKFLKIMINDFKDLICYLQAQKEAAEAEEMAKELGLNDKTDDGLRQLVMKWQKDRQGAMDDMIAGLEAKYCKPKKQKTFKGKKK